MPPLSPLLPPQMRDGGPLARSGSVPILYPALQATLYLESLSGKDIPALEEAMGSLDGWLGRNMRWAWSSVHAEVEPYRADDLDYIVYYPEQLRNPHAHTAATGDTAALLEHMDLMTRDVFGVSAHGGALRNQAAPYSLHFLGEVVDLPHGDWFTNACCLQIFVPVFFALDEFVARIDSLAQILPTRWGTAGLGLSHWEFDAHESTRSAIYGVARRYPGFDLPFCAGLLGHWRDRPRSVSWRTYLGRELAEAALARSGPDTRLVSVTKQKDIVVFQAGEVPEAGDHNSRQFPVAYGAMAQFLGAPPRVEGMSFGDPWTEESTALWLNRFLGN